MDLSLMEQIQPSLIFRIYHASGKPRHHLALGIPKQLVTQKVQTKVEKVKFTKYLFKADALQ